MKVVASFVIKVDQIQVSTIWSPIFPHRTSIDLKKEFVAEGKVIIPHSNVKKFKNFLAGAFRIGIVIKEFLNSFNSAVYIHVSIKSSYVTRYQKMFFIDPTIPNFIDKIICIFNVRRVFISQRFQKEVYVFTYSTSFGTTVTNNRSSFRHIWKGPFIFRFMNFGE